MATTKALELGQFGTDLTVDDSTGAVTIANDLTMNAATSTGIDDNADQTVITIGSDETVTIAGNLEVSEIGNNSTGLITIDVDATAHAMLRFQEAGSDLWRIVKEPTNELVIDQGAGDIDFTFSTTGDFTVHDGDVIIETGGIKGPSVLYIDPATYDTDSDAGSAAGTVRIRGDLIVDGDTTTINSTTLTVDDLNIVLASGAADAASADGAGITIDGANATITYDGTNDEWDFNKTVKVSGSLGVTNNASSGFDWQISNTSGNNAIRFEGATNASLYLDGNDGDFLGSDYGRIYHDGTSLYLGTHGANNLRLTEDYFMWNTNTSATPFYIGRSGGTSQSLKIMVDDASVNFHSIQDEATNGDFKFYLGTNGDQNTGFSVYGEGSATSLLDVRADGTTNIRGNVTVDNNDFTAEGTVTANLYKQSDTTPQPNKKPISFLKLDYGVSKNLCNNYTSFTRSSTASYFDESGSFKTAANNVPRFDHDPLTGECRGFLFEDASTNSIPYSDTSGNASVRATRGSSEYRKGILGYLYSDNGGGNPNTNYNYSTSSDYLWCWSFYLDVTNLASNAITVDFSVNGGASNGIKFNATFSDPNTTGTYDTVSLGSINHYSFAVADSGRASAQYLGENIWRISAGFNLSAVVNSMFPILYFGTGSSNVWTGGWQLEIGRYYPTSLIYTSAGAATRTAENATLVGIDNYIDTTSGFTAYYESAPIGDPARSGNGHCWALNGNNFLFFYGISAGGSTSMGHANRVSGGYTYAASVGVSNSTLDNVTFSKYAVRLLKNDGAGALNGSIENTDTSFEVNPQTGMNIGRGPGSSEYFNGYIKSIRLYSGSLSDVELQELTRQ